MQTILLESLALLKVPTLLRSSIQKRNLAWPFSFKYLKHRSFHLLSFIKSRKAVFKLYESYHVKIEILQKFLIIICHYIFHSIILCDSSGWDENSANTTIYLNPFVLFFRLILRYSLRQAHIVYRLIDAALIGDFYRYHFLFWNWNFGHTLPSGNARHKWVNNIILVIWTRLVRNTHIRLLRFTPDSRRNSNFHSFLMQSKAHLYCTERGRERTNRKPPFSFCHSIYPNEMVGLWKPLARGKICASKQNLERLRIRRRFTENRLWEK